MNRAITAAVFGKSGMLYTGGYDTVVRIWDGNTGELMGKLAAHQQRINALAVWDDYLVSVGADKRVIVWDIRENFEVVGKYECDEECTSVAVDEAYLVCGYTSGAIRVWPMVKRH